MSAEVTFNADEKDCLQELMNVAYGAATASIADIIDAFATLSVPQIEVIDAQSLKSYLSNNLPMETPHYIAMQLLNGDLSGENVFLIDKNSAVSLAHEFDLTDDDIVEEDLQDVILEITNILSSSVISSLIEEMDTHTTFSPPTIDSIQSIDEFDDQLITEYSKVIVISTKLTFDEKKINGTLMMLTTDKSIFFIKSVIEKILEEF